MLLIHLTMHSRAFLVCSFPLAFPSVMRSAMRSPCRPYAFQHTVRSPLGFPVGSVMRLLLFGVGPCAFLLSSPSVAPFHPCTFPRALSTTFPCCSSVLHQAFSHGFLFVTPLGSFQRPSCIRRWFPHPFAVVLYCALPERYLVQSPCVSKCVPYLFLRNPGIPRMGELKCFGKQNIVKVMKIFQIHRIATVWLILHVLY